MAQSFHVEEASIADIQRAIQSKKLTSTKLVELYLKRVKAYNGTLLPQIMLDNVEQGQYNGCVVNDQQNKELAQ